MILQSDPWSAKRKYNKKKDNGEIKLHYQNKKDKIVNIIKFSFVKGYFRHTRCPTKHDNW